MRQRRTSSHRFDGDLSPLTGPTRGMVTLLLAASQPLAALCRFAVVLNLALFFRNGRYRSVADSLVGARLAYHRRAVARAPGFEYVNARLVWDGVAEFALLRSAGSLRRSAVGRRELAGLDVVQGRVAGGEGVEEGCGICGSREVVMKHCAVCFVLRGWR